MQDKGPTPAATVFRARQIGLAEGLHYVYSGNARDMHPLVTITVRIPAGSARSAVRQGSS